MEPTRIEPVRHQRALVTLGDARYEIVRDRRGGGLDRGGIKAVYVARAACQQETDTAELQGLWPETIARILVALPPQ
jgi:hypothetical protein